MLMFQFDPAIQRFASMRMTRYDHFRPTPKTSLYGLALTVIPFLAITYFIKGKRVSNNQIKTPILVQLRSNLKQPHNTVIKPI